MTLEQRKTAFKSLGSYLQSPDGALKHLIKTAHLSNGWFTAEETAKAVKGIGYEGWMQIEGATPQGAEIIPCYQHNLNYLKGLFVT